MSIRVPASSLFRTFALRPISIATVIAAVSFIAAQPAAAQSRVIQKWVAQVSGPAVGNDGVNALTADSSGNVYVAGYDCVTASSPGNCTRTDLQIEKYNSSGQRLWGGSLQSGGDFAEGDAIAVDSAGNVYVAGSGNTGQKNTDGTAITEFIVIKYSAAGVRQWIRYYEGQGGEMTEGIESAALDANGNLYLCGKLGNGDSTATIGPMITLKYSAAGQQLWAAEFDLSKQNGGLMVGADANFPTGLAVDGAGNVYITDAASQDWTGATVKYDTNGHQSWYAITQEGDSTNSAIALDSAGNAYVAGSLGTITFTCGSGYLVKYGPEGNQLWMSELQDYCPTAIARDSQGNLYIASDSPPGSSSSFETTKVDADGSILWNKSYAAPSGAEAQTAAVLANAEDDVYLTGTEASSKSYQFVTLKYDGSGNQLWVTQYPKGGSLPGIAASGGNLYIAGTLHEADGQSRWATIDYVQDAAESSPSSVAFSAQKIDTTSGAQAITLKNTYSGDLTINNIETNGPFSETNNCSSVLTSGASCTIQVKFTPTEASTQTGSLSISDGWAGSPNLVTLSGMGTN